MTWRTWLTHRKITIKISMQLPIVISPGWCKCKVSATNSQSVFSIINIYSEWKVSKARSVIESIMNTITRLSVLRNIKQKYSELGKSNIPFIHCFSVLYGMDLQEYYLVMQEMSGPDWYPHPPPGIWHEICYKLLFEGGRGAGKGRSDCPALPPFIGVITDHWCDA